MGFEYDTTEVRVLDSVTFPAGEGYFPYSLDIGGRFLCGDSYYTYRDSFTQSLLLYTCEGEGEVLYRGKNIILQPGMMILLDGKYPHRYGTVKGKKWDFFWFHYNDRSPCTFADYFFEKGIVIQKIPQDEFQIFFSGLKEAIGTHSVFGAMQNSMILSEFLGSWGMVNAKKLYTGLSEKEQIVHRVQKYIRENYKRKITVEDLAKYSSFSKYYFIRLFRENTGMTPHQYLLYVRIGQAKILLLSTSDTVELIGEQVGFENVSSFIAAFKKIVGTTPLNFRNRGV